VTPTKKRAMTLGNAGRACSLRDLFAVTPLADQNLFLRSVQITVEHSNVNTTADDHAHISQEAERETARIAERAIYGDLFPSCFSFGSGNTTAAAN
jgi:hypothetical protein